jgi:hypothetical protein
MFSHGAGDIPKEKPMSLGKQMIEQLRLLAAAETLSSADPHTLTALDGAAQATLAFFDHDRFSVTLRGLDVGGALFEGDAHAYLSACAAEIARRLSYLEEPLAVWELDGAERVAQLRSSPPQRDGDEVSYWEVTLAAGAQLGARIARYRWAPGMVEREVVAYPATFALVGRMVDSLRTALAESEH